jgi:serralysin
MGKQIIVRACLWLAIFSSSVPAYGYIADDRWTRTATNASTGPEGTPITLTWSFAPENTQIPSTLSIFTDNLLISFLDATFGSGPGGNDFTRRPWFTHFNSSFLRLSQLSGVQYVYEPNDDGMAFSEVYGQGILGTRGDIRIGATAYETSGTLASNWYPDYGEMIFNTLRAALFSIGDDNYLRLRNTTMHEALHGLGISHVSSNNAAFLAEPALNLNFDGPQLDEVLALQRLYGDVRERNGGNDTYQSATSLGQLRASQSISIGTLGDSTVVDPLQLDFISIDDDSDTDFFRFSIAEPLDVQLSLTPRGTSYMIGSQGDEQTLLNTLAMSNLSLALFRGNGTSLLTMADANPAGLGEQIVRQLSPGTYFARVRGDQNDIQLYGLDLLATIPLVGDFNQDGTVDAADYVLWRKNINSEAAYDQWSGQFGESSGTGGGTYLAGPSADNATPEPSALLLALGSITAPVLRPRRQAVRCH